MILFNELMKHFPVDQFPCRTSREQPRYENQCAIRLSVALVGVDPHFLDDYPGNKCPHGHARGARGLARYLLQKLGEPKRPNSRNDIAGQGILFYRRAEINHIDVWSSWVCLPRYGHGDCRTMSSTYADALDLWFWPLRG